MRIPARARSFAALKTAEPAKGPRRFDLISVVAGPSCAVTDVAITDGDISARAITFNQIRDGLIWRQREFWPDPYPAPAWRAPFVQSAAEPPF